MGLGFGFGFGFGFGLGLATHALVNGAPKTRRANGADMSCSAPVAKTYGPRSAVSLSGVPLLEGLRCGT